MSNRYVARVALASLLLFAFTAALAAQAGTDFSGRWVLEGAAAGGATEVPQRLVVHQPITTTSLRGAPIPPAYLYLTVERRFADRVQKDSYQVGVEGGIAGGVVRENTDRTETAYSRWSVRWVGNILRLEWTTVAASGATTGAWRRGGSMSGRGSSSTLKGPKETGTN